MQQFQLPGNSGFTLYRSGVCCDAKQPGQMSGLFASQNARKCAFIPTGFFVPYSSPRQRNRKVTIWARVQFVLGLKVVSLVPLVTPFSTAHSTASA